MIIEYTLAKECKNEDVWYACYKCGKCGRVFENGFMVNNGGITIEEEEISKKRSEAQSKEVTQYDFDGRIVAIWRNAYVAEEHGYNRTMINQCCLGNKKSHKGYVWKYTSNIEKQIPKQPKEYEDKYYACPNCGNVTMMKWERYPDRLMDKSNGLPYCLGCGQRLDWGNEDAYGRR